MGVDGIGDGDVPGEVGLDDGVARGDMTAVEEAALDGADLEGGPDAPFACEDAAGCPEGLGCSGGVCGPCQGGGDCREGEGCVGGTCGPCEENGDCAEGLVCRKGEHSCVGCRVAGECDQGLACVAGLCGSCQAGPDCGGRLCDPVTGQCVDCEPGVSGDQACADQYGDEGLFCRLEPSGAYCTRSCVAGSDCTSVQGVCKDGTCEGCVADQECVSEGTGGYPALTRCIAGRCVHAGCASDKECYQTAPHLPVCDAKTHTCRPCMKAHECDKVVKERGEGQGGVCLASGACAPGDCGSVIPEENGCPAPETGKVCRGNQCGECAGPVDDLECQKQYASGYVCVGGRCVPGCALPSYNAMGQVCGPDHRWRDCASDNECVASYFDLNKVCDPVVVGGVESMRCTDGLAPGKPCYGEGPWVVGQDHRCHPCDEVVTTPGARDSACKTAYGSPYYVCEKGACVLGCIPGSRCRDGRLCGMDNRCHPCVNEKDDGACGVGYLCIQGVCVQGQCRDNEFCKTYYNDTICVNHQCVPCGQDTPCPGGSVCQGGKCVPGHCCVDPDCVPQVSCGPGQSCNGHYCEGCNVGDQCHVQHPCLNKSGACTADHKCRPAEELDVLSGWCFIGGVCRRWGEVAKDSACLICYWQVGDSGTVVQGSKREWTPGSWSDKENKWTADWCLIGDLCIAKGSIAEQIRGYEGLQSANCLWCDPREDDWQSLHWLSPRPDPVQDPHVDWTRRIQCDDPLFVNPTAESKTALERAPPYAGTTYGYCWAGTCLGISWTPYLPVGVSGWGVTGETPGASTLHGSFGGGFGAGIPNPNLGGAPDVGSMFCPKLGGCQ